MRLPKAGSPPPRDPEAASWAPLPSRSFPVVVHPFLSETPNSCAYERGNLESPNGFVYVGGLTSGPHTQNELVSTLLAALNEADLGYSIWEFRMRSSYAGWAHSTLDNDAKDIGAFVTYLRNLGKKRIVLMGSSTDPCCQDCMRYMQDDPNIFAYILQAPTSDRLTATTIMAPEDYKRSLDYTRDQIIQDNLEGIVPKELVPIMIKEPVTVHRWYSMIGRGSNEDYFHPDLNDETMSCMYRVVNRPTLMLPSENDELIPPTVDKTTLLWRWIRASSLGVSQLSAVVPEADHTLSTVASRRWAADQVVRFLRSVDAAQE